MLEDPEKLNRIEELKTKLSGKNYRMRIGGRDDFTHPIKKSVADSWPEKGGKEEEKLSERIFAKTSAFKRFFIFSVVFFLLAAAFAVYTFFVKSNTISNDNIDISILGNAFVAGGESLPLRVEVVNRNSSPLELSDLLVEYPKGSGTDLSQDAERQRISIGTIAAGAVSDETASIVLFGEQGSVRPVRISLEYRVEGSNAIFVKEKDYQVTISSTPVNLSVDMPSDASPNQDLTMEIKTVLNATSPAKGMLLEADYPVGFQFESANPAPSFGNNIWSLGDLSPGAERDISITGKMIGVSDGEEKTFHISTGSASGADQSQIGVVFNSLAENLLIKKPFIDARLFINGSYDAQYAVNGSSSISGQIQWANNLDTQVNDMQIVAKISGDAVDQSRISSADGFYSSSDNTITWDKNSDPDLGQVAPGSSGTLKFSMAPLPLYGPSGLISNPTIQVDVSVSGNEPIQGNAPASLANSDSKTIRIISDVGLSARASYSSGPFTNSGPIPPKVDQKTTYTIAWSVTNTANNISKAEVQASLPAWVSFVGSPSPPSEDLSYDPNSRVVTWNIGNIAKGAGITGAGRQVSFQVELLPSVSQLNTDPVLVNGATLTGHDDFANVDVTADKASLNTLLTGDPSFPVSGDRVVQ